MKFLLTNKLRKCDKLVLMLTLVRLILLWLNTIAKKTFNLFEEGEEEALLAEIETKVEEIKARYPYPVEESSATISKMEITEE